MYDVGKRIKQLRTKNNLSLDDLASRTELTKGFLSQLERNLTSPSLQTLEDIVSALGVDMSTFFKEEKDEQVAFTKADAFVDEQEDRIIHWIVPNAQKNEMEPIILEIHKQCSSQIVKPHHGEEFGYVLAGTIVIERTQAQKRDVIKKGECFYLKGNETYCLKNESDVDSKILWISTAEIF